MLSNWLILVLAGEYILSSHILNILRQDGIEPQSACYAMELITTKWIYGVLDVFYLK
jgi:hypothetical protein